MKSNLIESPGENYDAHFHRLIIKQNSSCSPNPIQYMLRERPNMAVVMMDTGAPVLGRGPSKTSQVGPFCLAASFLWLQQECSLRNLAPVAWHLVKLIHRQETNCQIKWVSSSLPLPSRFACGWDSAAFLPLFFLLLFSRHINAKRWELSCRRTREVGFPQAAYCS